MFKVWITNYVEIRLHYVITYSCLNDVAAILV